MLRWLTGQSRSHNIAKVASSNDAHRETPQGPVIKEKQHPFEIHSLCMHTVLQQFYLSKNKGGPTPTVGRSKSPHGCILAGKSHASVNWSWRPLNTILWERL